MNYKRFYGPLVATLAITLSASICVAEGAKPTLDDLLQQVRSGSEIERSLARQLIPRYGIDPVHNLIPLLFLEDSSVSSAANKIILDIANDVSVPGREAERDVVAQQLLDALAATDVQKQQFILLRILPVVLPEGADIQAISALLYRDNTKERARRAIQESNTAEGRAALRGALPDADEAFACALMDALNKTQDDEATPLILAKLHRGTDAEKAAAALALARTGDATLVEPFVALANSIDINHQFQAEDAVLRLADALVRTGGKWDASMALYRTMLAQSVNPVIQGGALAGLGRFGDESVLDTIMSTWTNDASGLLEGPAVAAIEAINDPAMAPRLSEVYAGQPVAVKEKLLGIMARTQDPRFVPVFQSATDIAPAIQIDALTQYRLPECVPLLEGLAATSGPEDKTAAIAAITTMATAFRDQGDHAGAGRAYLSLYRTADNDETRNTAMEGIKAFPVPEAFDQLKQALGDDGLLELQPSVLTGMARVLAEAGRTDESNELKTILMSRANDTASVQQLLQMGPVSGSNEDFARQLGFVNQWHIAQPFALKDAPTDGSPVLVDGVVDLSVTFGEGDGAVRWIPTPGAGAMALVNFPLQDQVRAFAYVTVHVAEAQEATLRIGSDDGVRAWVNGVKVHENDIDRGTALDSDLVPISLKAGDNALLLEIIQHAGGWNFCARLTTPDGFPLQFEQK